MFPGSKGPAAIAAVVFAAGIFAFGAVKAQAGVRPLQFAQTGGQLDIEAITACEDGNAVFKITNKGHEWPTVSKFSVYRVKGNTLVSQRRMRLTVGQQASFRVKAGGGGERVELGIFIEPEWFAREFRFDAKIAC